VLDAKPPAEDVGSLKHLVVGHVDWNVVRLAAVPETG
jgi:hypothetical protein